MDSNSNKALTDTRFSDLKPPLLWMVLEVLAESGFEFCTPVQAATIPLLCRYKDVAVDAATSSGKNPSFCGSSGRDPPPCLFISKSSPGDVDDYLTYKGAIVAVIKCCTAFISTLSNVTSMLLVGGGEVKADVKKIEEEVSKFVDWDAWEAI